MGRPACCVCQHWPLDLCRKRCFRRRPKLFPWWGLRHRDILVWHQIRKVTASTWESNTAWLETLWGLQEMQHYSGSSRFCNFDMWGHNLGKTRVIPHPPGTFLSRGNQSDRNRGEECEKTGFWETLWSFWELARWNIEEDEAGPFLLQQEGPFVSDFSLFRIQCSGENWKVLKNWKNIPEF